MPPQVIMKKLNYFELLAMKIILHFLKIDQYDSKYLEKAFKIQILILLINKFYNPVTIKYDSYRIKNRIL